jgi:hypothetical protein
VLKVLLIFLLESDKVDSIKGGWEGTGNEEVYLGILER